MAYKQETDSPLGHCWATVMHLQPWNKMRNRTAAAAGKGTGNNPSLAKAEEKRSLRRGEYIKLYGYQAWLDYVKKHDIPENSKWADAHKN